VELEKLEKQHLGTVHFNSVCNCTFSSDREMKKKGWGYFVKNVQKQMLKM
jgi:hypothetical protein